MKTLLWWAWIFAGLVAVGYIGTFLTGCVSYERHRQGMAIARREGYTMGLVDCQKIQFNYLYEKQKRKGGRK